MESVDARLYEYAIVLQKSFIHLDLEFTCSAKKHSPLNLVLLPYAYEEESSGGEEEEPSSIFLKLGPVVFKDIVEKSPLFSSPGPFPLNRTDTGTQNIVVDDSFNFLALIDWEFAQSAPWEVNHHPMPFPLLSTDAEIADILADANQLAHANVPRQDAARKSYRRAFHDNEMVAEEQKRGISRSIAEVFESRASRIWAAFEKIGVFGRREEELVFEMVRLGFRFEGDKARRYFKDMETRICDGAL